MVRFGVCWLLFCSFGVLGLPFRFGFGVGLRGLLVVLEFDCSGGWVRMDGCVGLLGA